MNLIINLYDRWSAIVRGAAAKGLEADDSGAIRSRICRRHYGTACNSQFQPRQHEEIDAFVCPFTGLKRARNQMDWIIKKYGELRASNTSHGKINMCTNHWIGSSKILIVALMASDLDQAPSSSCDPVSFILSDGNPELTNQYIYTVAQMVVDLNPVPKREWRKAFSPTGRPYCALDFSVEISIQSALEYSLSVNGVRYGSVTANYA